MILLKLDLQNNREMIKKFERKENYERSLINIKQCTENRASKNHSLAVNTNRVYIKINGVHCYLTDYCCSLKTFYVDLHFNPKVQHNKCVLGCVRVYVCSSTCVKPFNVKLCFTCPYFNAFIVTFIRGIFKYLFTNH